MANHDAARAFTLTSLRSPEESPGTGRTSVCLLRAGTAARWACVGKNKCPLPHTLNRGASLCLRGGAAPAAGGADADAADRDGAVELIPRTHWLRARSRRRRRSVSDGRSSLKTLLIWMSSVSFPQRYPGIFFLPGMRSTIRCALQYATEAAQSLNCISLHHT